MLFEAGIQQIIPPINTIHGQPIQKIDDFTFIVYPFVEGQNGFISPLNDTQWFALGKAISQVHNISVPKFIEKEVRRETFSSKWREAVRLLYTHLESYIPGDEIGSKLAKFMRENRTAINRLVDQAEELGKKVRNQTNKFVLCHSDIHGGNVLINGDAPIYIVDWDEPIMAPKERDLMFIGGGVANVWNNPHEVELFYKGYGATEINTELLAYYRHERIVEDIAILGEELLMSPVKRMDRKSCINIS